jgi:hypothetical protein
VIATKCATVGLPDRVLLFLLLSLARFSGLCPGFAGVQASPFRAGRKAPAIALFFFFFFFFFCFTPLP